jgi:hypothetical protein
MINSYEGFDTPFLAVTKENKWIWVVIGNFGRFLAIQSDSDKWNIPVRDFFGGLGEIVSAGFVPVGLWFRDGEFLRWFFTGKDGKEPTKKMLSKSQIVIDNYVYVAGGISKFIPVNADDIKNEDDMMRKLNAKE